MHRKYKFDGAVLCQGRERTVSATSHNLPEIDFIEIAESENLAQISERVRDKLARFKADAAR